MIRYAYYVVKKIDKRKHVMLTAMEKQILRKNLEKYEGRIEHMYKDTKGFITVGVGHLIKNLTAAQALDFIHQTTNKKQKTKNQQKKRSRSTLNLLKNLQQVYLLQFIKIAPNLNLRLQLLIKSLISI